MGTARSISKLSLVAGALAALMALSGCGGSTATTADAGTASSGTTTTPTGTGTVVRPPTTPTGSTSTPTGGTTTPSPVVTLQLAGTPLGKINVGQSYSFTPVLTVPAGETALFHITNQPSWAKFSTSTGQLSGIPVSANVGTTSNITIAVTGGTTTVTLLPFSIQVVASNVVPTLTAIALSPLVVKLAPGASQQLTLQGVFSNSTTQTLSTADATFHTSNSAVATVNTSGLVTIAAHAAAGATAIISATDGVSGMTTSSSTSTQISVAAVGIGPTANSAAAAKATAQSNPLCGTPVAPFYWEIGDQTGALLSGSVGVDSSGKAVTAATSYSIASASKWIYSTYVTQVRGAAANLTAQDIEFLHFTSGYTNMGDGATACPKVLYPDTVSQCLTQVNSQGVSYAAKDPTTVGSFYYDGGHMENHAKLLTTLGNVVVGSLGQNVLGTLGMGSMIYTQPLMSGGLFTNAQSYAAVLQHMLDGSLFIREALGTNPVCTHPSKTCNATYTPIPEAWHYSIGHWVEDDPATHGDGAFSSPGAFGFYPWIEASKKYYGVISREAPQGTGEQQGYASAQCGRLIRHAWMTGVEQTGTLPTT